MDKFITNWIYSYKNRKNLHDLFSQMVNYINELPLENTLKFRKMNKMLKLFDNLESLHLGSV